MELLISLFGQPGHITKQTPLKFPLKWKLTGVLCWYLHKHTKINTIIADRVSEMKSN